MIERIVDYPVQLLLKNELINSEDIELYRFGVNRLVLFCINIITSIGIGLLCGMVWESILFSLAYIPLRRFAGGYHAETPTSCYFQSTILVLSVLCLIHIFPHNSTLLVLVILISAGVIFKKAPMGSKQRKLNSKEIAAFGKKARSILAMELILFFLFLVISWKIALYIGMAVVCSAVMLVIGEQGSIIRKNTEN